MRHIEHAFDIKAPVTRAGSPRAIGALYHRRQQAETDRQSLLPEETVTAAGLSADPAEYQRRLDEQADEQIDSWAVELMRDMSIRTGVLGVLEEFGHACRLDEDGILRVFSAGGGAPATAGRTADGRLMLPAVSLRYLVPGLRREVADARQRLIGYLVASFAELVYI